MAEDRDGETPIGSVLRRALTGAVLAIFDPEGADRAGEAVLERGLQAGAKLAQRLGLPIEFEPRGDGEP